MEDVLINFRLVGDEARALRELALDQVRRPRDQVRHLLRCELERRGLLLYPEGHAAGTRKEGVRHA